MCWNETVPDVSNAVKRVMRMDEETASEEWSEDDLLNYSFRLRQFYHAAYKKTLAAARAASDSEDVDPSEADELGNLTFTDLFG